MRPAAGASAVTSLAIQATAVKYASQLASVTVIFPFLCVACGGSTLAAGLVLPAYLIGSLVGASAAPSVLSAAKDRRRVLTTSAMVVAVSLGTTAGLGWWLHPASAAVSAVFVLGGFAASLAAGAGGVSFNDALGATTGAGRVVLLFGRSGLAAVLAAVTSVVLGAWTRHTATLTSHVLLVWWASGLLLVVSLGCHLRLSVASPRAAQQDAARPASPTTRVVQRPGWFRSHIGTQLLLLPTTIGTSFYSVHEAAQRSGVRGSLNVIVVATSLGLLVGSALWPWTLARRGFGTLFAASAALGLCAALMGLLEDAAKLDTVWWSALVMLPSTLAVQATRSGRRAYLLDHATATERAQLAAAERRTLLAAAVTLACILSVVAEVSVGVTVILLGAGNLFALATLLKRRRSYQRTAQPTPASPA